jgi:queuine tRNA-ribosyltransferase
MLQFKLSKVSAQTQARVGELITPRGRFKTPLFMPVATYGTVRGLTSEELLAEKFDIIVSNAYHLYLRPGINLIKEAGGLHKFINWNKAILTDSGGYQIFSLARFCKIKPEGVEFQSPIDGSYHFLSPEEVVENQINLGVDFLIALDICSPWPCSYNEAKKNLALTIAWAKRSFNRAKNNSLLCVLQGSVYLDLRKWNIEEFIELDLPGYAIGGVSVGEPKEKREEVIEFTTSTLPTQKFRYLMGIGKPGDIVKAISCGVDLFDSVIPTREGRNGTAYTWEGKIVLRNAPYATHFQPISEKCSCFTCRNYTRAYLRHLLQVKEMLAARLISLHNLHFYSELMVSIREAIKNNTFEEIKKKLLEVYP